MSLWLLRPLFSWSFQRASLSWSIILDACSEKNGVIYLACYSFCFWCFICTRSWFLTTDIKYISLTTLVNLSSTCVRKSCCSKRLRGISASRSRVIQGCCRAYSMVYRRDGFGSHNFSIRLWVSGENRLPNLSFLKLRTFSRYMGLSSPFSQRGCFPAISSYMMKPAAHTSTGLP